MILTNCGSVPGREIEKVIDIIFEPAVVTKNVTEPVMSNFKKAFLSTFETFKMGPNIITGKELTGMENEKKSETIKSEPIKTDNKKIESNIEDESLKELPAYTNLLKVSTEIVKERLTKTAEKLGADAVINITITTTVTMLHAFEIIAYGTAVKLK